MAQGGFYDINAQEDSTFQFHVEYYDNNGNAVDLTGYTARFHVRPYTDSSVLYMEITTAGVTTGGSTGSYSAGGGVKGTGGIYLNRGETGGVFTGGVLVAADYLSMGNINPGKWWYSLDITKGVTNEEILYGRFVVNPKGTR